MAAARVDEHRGIPIYVDLETGQFFTKPDDTELGRLDGASVSAVKLKIDKAGKKKSEHVPGWILDDIFHGVADKAAKITVTSVITSQNRWDGSSKDCWIRTSKGDRAKLSGRRVFKDTAANRVAIDQWEAHKQVEVEAAKKCEAIEKKLESFK